MATTVSPSRTSDTPAAANLPRSIDTAATRQPPAAGAEQAPSFIDAAECAAWLQRVPLANVSLAQPILLRQLKLLHRHDLLPGERAAILETLRRPVIAVQADAANAFAGRPLPLAPPEQAALERTLDLWQTLAQGYLRCFFAVCDDQTGRSRSLPALPALLAQRTISVFADWQVDLCRGEELPDAAYWLQLHRVFAAAERLGVEALAVSDPVRHGATPTSALAAYAECNLLSTASAYELPARHIAWVARWARRWGAKLELLKVPPDDIRNRAVPLWVDLDAERPPGHVPQATGNGRWLETTELRKSLAARIALLEQGRAPAELQLGDDVAQPAAGQLLQRLRQRWCAGGAQRREERHAATGSCRVVAGFEAVHFQLSGRQAFRAPSRDDATLRREREEFETFGEHRHTLQTDSGPDDSHVENWLVMDDWQVVNESATGLCLARPLRAGVRIGAGMLIAVKIGSGQRFALACVRWALRGTDDMLLAGIQLFPGEARPVAIRVIDPDERTATWRQGLLLPEIPALRIPTSLVIPAGSFKLERCVQVMVDHQPRVVKLFRILERGIEFERCSLYADD
jgi:hypothetical protein